VNVSRNLLFLVVCVLAVFALFHFVGGGLQKTAYQSMSYSEFISAVDSGDVREEVDVRCDVALLVAMHVLLEHAELPGELALRAITAHLCEALGKLLLEAFDGGSTHVLDFSIGCGSIVEPS